MVVSTVNLSSWHQISPRQLMDKMTWCHPRRESGTAGTLPDSYSQKHIPAQNNRVMGVVTPAIAEQELAGGVGGADSAHTASYSPQAAPGEKPSHTFQVSIRAVISPHRHKKPVETILPSLQMKVEFHRD